MNILLVDDNTKFLTGLRNMLESHGYEVLGMASSAEAAVGQTLALTPDLVLMDIQMPGESGIEATRVLKQANPSLRIVMMTVSDCDEHLFDAVVAGADGYLIKGEPDRFIDALASLERGEAPFSPGLAQKIMAEFARRSHSQAPLHKDKEPDADPWLSAPVRPGDVEKLTKRQYTILSMVAEGRPYQEIAGELGIAVATINYHMAEIVARLRVENRSQAIAYISAQKSRR